jgi:pimeloyl-ACP methyl ester carboxylesterase
MHQHTEDIKVNKTPIDIKLPGEEFEINADLRIADTEVKNLRPLLIFVHGFKGFKDWGGFPYAMERIAQFGFAVVSFNFTHDGVSKETPQDFSRLDMFAKNTFSRELDETGHVINHFYEHAEEYGIDRNKIGIIGHSRGGGIAILRSAEDTRIKALVTLASVSNFDRYPEERKKQWKATGYFDVLNTRTNQMMRMNAELLYDIENNKERLDILKAIGTLSIPVMIIHGKEDLAVSPDDAEALFENSDREQTQLHIIENTGHTFGVEHPFKGSTFQFDIVISLTADFMKKALS